VFNSKFLKEFLCQKDSSLFVLKGWKNQQKEESLGIIFDLHFYFLSIFFVILISKLFIFSH